VPGLMPIMWWLRRTHTDMSIKYHQLPVLLCFVILIAQAAASPFLLLAAEATINIKLEQKIAEALPEEQRIWLTLAEKKWLAIYRPLTTTGPFGTLVQLPEAGQLASQNKVLHQLSLSLIKKGWRSLSLTSPFKENITNKLVISAIAKAKEKLNGQIYLLLYGSNNEWLKLSHLNSINGLILLNATFKDTKNLQLLAQARKPILDIVGSRDRAISTSQLEHRKAMLKASGAPYRQLIFNGVDRNFKGLNPSLTRNISGWLNSLAKSKR